MMNQIKYRFGGCENNLSLAIEWLEELILDYEKSGLDKQTVAARVAAIKGKIGVIDSIKLDPTAHPWSEDKF